jgi:hypothetical protein
MKKDLIITVSVFISLLLLVACSSIGSVQESNGRDIGDPFQNPEMSTTQRDSEEGIPMTDSQDSQLSSLKPKDSKEPARNESSVSPNYRKSATYSIHHEKDDTTYTVILSWDALPLSAFPDLINDPLYKNNPNITFNEKYTVQLFNANSNILQTISLNYDVFAGIAFEDLNCDGYIDIVINTGGTINETHDLYVWNASSKNFVKVIYQGFDMLSWFEVHDGYVDNFIRGSSPDDSVKEKLVWDGNVLTKVSEY